jgi:hypothetical protein
VMVQWIPPVCLPDNHVLYVASSMSTATLEMSPL